MASSSRTGASRGFGYNTRMRWTLVACLMALVLVGCADAQTTKRANTPEWDMKNVKDYAETVAGLPPEKVLGWDLLVVDDVARWRECTAVDACGQVERSRPTKDLLAVARVAHTSVEGRQVDVLELSLAPRPTYVVPYAKTAQR